MIFSFRIAFKPCVVLIFVCEQSRIRCGLIMARRIKEQKKLITWIILIAVLFQVAGINFAMTGMGCEENLCASAASVCPDENCLELKSAQPDAKKDHEDSSCPFKHCGFCLLPCCGGGQIAVFFEPVLPRL